MIEAGNFERFFWVWKSDDLQVFWLWPYKIANWSSSLLWRAIHFRLLWLACLKISAYSSLVLWFTNICIVNLSGDPTEMMITWVTMGKAVKSVVEYWERYKPPLNKRAYGSVTEYETCSWKKRIIYIHRVKLEGLVPGRGYGMIAGIAQFSTWNNCWLHTTS